MKIYSYIESHKVWNKHNPHDKIKIERGCGTGNSEFAIHHKDGDHNNNDIENLQKVTREKHNSIHKKGNTYMLGKKGIFKHTEEYKRKLSKTVKGNKNYFFGKKHTEEAKRKISEKAKGHKRRLGAILSEETKKKISESVKSYYKKKNEN